MSKPESPFDQVHGSELATPLIDGPEPVLVQVTDIGGRETVVGSVSLDGLLLSDLQCLRFRFFDITNAGYAKQVTQHAPPRAWLEGGLHTSSVIACIHHADSRIADGVFYYVFAIQMSGDARPYWLSSRFD